MFDDDDNSDDEDDEDVSMWLDIFVGVLNDFVVSFDEEENGEEVEDDEDDRERIEGESEEEDENEEKGDINGLILMLASIACKQFSIIRLMLNCDVIRIRPNLAIFSLFNFIISEGELKWIYQEEKLRSKNESRILDKYHRY